MKSRLNSNFIRFKIIEKFGTVSAFADKLGYSRQTIYSKLDGTIGLSYEDILNFIELLELTEDETKKAFFQNSY